MMKHCSLLFIFGSLLLWACKTPEAALRTGQEISVSSPDGQLQVMVGLRGKGEPYYRVLRAGTTVVDTSRLGFELQGFSLKDHFYIEDVKKTSFDETWAPVWGQYRTIRNHYNQLQFELEGKDDRDLAMTFRVYDYGVGFRYEFEEEDNMNNLEVLDELTEFRMTDNHRVWWVPGCWENDEYPYTNSRINTINTTWYKEKYNNVHARHIPELHGVNTPVTMQTDKGICISIHEAALVNFAGMSLSLNPATYTFKSNLAEAVDDRVKARISAPFQTPWRTLQITTSPAQLIETAYLIENLNEPNKLTDVSYIKPTKYMGIWWEMHLGLSSWNYTEKENLVNFKDWASVKPHGRHGATTANAKRYIDACAKLSVPALLIEGWNTGWEDWQGDNNHDGIFDFTTPYPDFDIKEVVRYGKDKGVRIIGHHETAAGVATYDMRSDTAMRMYKSLGIDAVKTGYVGYVTKHRHYDQFMVNHYNKIMELAAKHGLMLNVHEPIKPTGLCRTYPNLVSGEGMRGMEFNAWTEGNKTDHCAILPFTRNLAGAMDYTPGIMDLQYRKTKNKDKQPPYENAIRNTLAHQLALYVVFYSPIQMVADLPDNYEGQPMYEFIRSVGTDWDDTRVLNAAIGEYVTIARKQKGKEAWFIGSITNQLARNFELSLDFLPKGKNFIATIYADGKEGHWDNNPYDSVIRKKEVNANDKLSLRLGAGGGCAISIVPAYE